MHYEGVMMGSWTHKPEKRAASKVERQAVKRELAGGDEMEDPTRAVAPADELDALIEAAERDVDNYRDDDRECIVTDVLNAFYAGAKWGRAKGLEEAAEACADVEERPWYGYENPNTFDDGKRKCAEAIRSLAPAVPTEHQKMMEIARRVIAEHRDVLIALKDR